MKQRETWRVEIPEPYKTRLLNNQCPNCGKDKDKWKRRTDWTCCCKKCSDEYYGNNGFTGRVIYSWPDVRMKAFKRDNHICNKCGFRPTIEILVDNEEHRNRIKLLKSFIKIEKKSDGEYATFYDSSGSKLIGDHIIPIALGGEEFDLSNVQTLCKECDKIKTKEDQKEIAKERRIEKKLVDGQKQLTEEKMIKIEQTNWEWVDINKLKIDGNNPNVMSKKERAALRKNLETFGWNMPIITDMDFLIADGEQKWEVAKEMKLPKVPVLRKNLTENERRIIRQSMNRLRGTMDEELNAEEFKKILAESNLEDLTLLTAISEQEILNAINRADEDTKEILEKEMDVAVERTIDCPHCKGKIKILKKGEVQKG